MDRACDRCSGGGWGADSEFDQAPSHCTEINMGFGVLAWLCLDCRKSFYSLMRNDELLKSHGIISMKLDFWRGRISHDTKDEYLEIGLGLLSEINSLESLINDRIENWLSACAR